MTTELKTLEQNLDNDLHATIDPTNALAFLMVAEENANVIKVSKLTTQLQSPDVVDILKIHLKCNLEKWEAEKEMESDLLSQAAAQNVRLTDRQKGLFMKHWRVLQLMEEQPKDGAKGYFFELEEDRDLALERYNDAECKTVQSAMIAQSIIDNPRVAGVFVSHAEANTGACNTLIPQIKTASF